MSVNTTPFLHLPQWEANEQPSYLGEINPAFSAIDSGYGDIKTLAQTGVSSSQEAVTTANAAKAQSQANAGAITTLQQEHTALAADFVNSHHTQQVALQCTPVDGVPITIVWGRVTYNAYCAHFEFLFRFTTNINKTDNPGATYPIINIEGVPGTILRAVGFTNAVASDENKNAQYNAACYLKQNVIELWQIRPNDTINAGTYMATFNLPIFYGSTTKEAVLDGCMYI